MYSMQRSCRDQGHMRKMSPWPGLLADKVVQQKGISTEQGREAWRSHHGWTCDQVSQKGVNPKP